MNRAGGLALPMALRTAATDATIDCRGFIVDHANCLDLVRSFLGQLCLDLVRLRAAAPVARDELRPTPEFLRQFLPLRRKMPGLKHQNTLARRQCVDQRRLPRTGSGSRVDEDVFVGLEDALESIQRSLPDFGEIRSAVIDGLLRKRAEDAVR